MDNKTLRYYRYIAFIVLWFCSLLPSSLSAFDIVDSDDIQLSLSGYFQSVSGFQRLNYEIPLDTPNTSGLNGNVLRFNWVAYLGANTVVDIHNRIFWQVSPQSPIGIGDSMGIGASVVPNRLVDLSTTLLDENGFILGHDIDRLALRYFFSRGELIAGRQAITWGESMLFPVADLWAQFSPFELDQTEKRGTDAIRLLFYPSNTLQLDIVIADKGSLDELSGAVKASSIVNAAEIYGAVGKFWNQLLLLGGITYDFVDFKGRVEVVGPCDLDNYSIDLPRGTIGIDYLGENWQITGEYHFNGTGTIREKNYIEQLSKPAFQRGESYYLNQHYTGIATSYTGIDHLTISVAAMGNIVDHSALLSPSIGYDLSANTDITLGAFQGIGASPTFTPLPQFNSEFGTYGAFYYAQMRGFF